MGAEAPIETQRRYHERFDPHRRRSMLVDIVLGGQDGLVNVLGIVLGVAAAGASLRLIAAAGSAAALAEAVSMAAVAYTSTVTAGQRYEAERAREFRHLDRSPDIERAEIREIFQRQGFEGEGLERIVELTTSNREAWVSLMMLAEHRLAPKSRGDAWRSTVIVGVSALVGSLVPLLPAALIAGPLGSAIALAASAAALFAFGAYKARVTIGRTLRGGLELTAIGILSALAGLGVGTIFGAVP